MALPPTVGVTIEQLKRGAAVVAAALAIGLAAPVAADDAMVMLTPETDILAEPADLACIDEALAQFEDLVFGEIGPPGRQPLDASRQAALDAAVAESQSSPLVSAE